MRRRAFMSLAAAASVAVPASAQTASQTRRTATRTRSAATSTSCSGTDQLRSLSFHSTCSLLDSNLGALTDDSVVAVWAEDAATTTDQDGNDDAFFYADSTPIPLAGVDGTVVGFGSVLVNDSDANFDRGNEEFVLNVWDDQLGGSGTVLWDEGHGQFYTLGKFSAFESYAESNGYAVTPTSDLAADLSGADAAVVTSPSTAFTSGELDALASFVGNGGALFLHDQSDHNDFDETGNLNAVADRLGLAFRFNDDEVQDGTNNDGEDYQPVTDRFNDAFPFFADRDGLGLEAGETYDVTVTDVTDGDTVDVEFPDGTEEEVRVLGLDTPETKRNSRFERIQEWEGIEDDKHLSTWGGNASDYATAELDGRDVTLFFDENEPVRDVFGRLLGYVRYDESGDGSRDTLYNEDLVRKGYARVYDSGFAKHDSFLAAETDARSAGRRVWSASDPDASSEIRDRAVDDLFFPKASSVRTDSGAVSASRVPVVAESTATQDLGSDGVSYAEPPLVAVDEDVNVAVVGGLTVNEAYEADEDFAVDTSGYENFVFLTNLLDYLADRTGDVLFDGGHGQFNDAGGLSAEDAAYYLRYLEGQDVALQGVNAITGTNLSSARAVVVTTPSTCFTSTEVDSLSTFASNGGAVVLMGSTRADAGARANLDALASGLGSDLRLNDDRVLDDSSNVNDDPTIPVTTTFDASFPLFDAYT